MALRPVASVLLAGLAVLPALAFVQYWRHRLHRWRLALASGTWLILLSSVVPELTGPVLSTDTVLWPALVIASAVGGMAALALTSWFWLRRDRPERATESGV